jgi:hypothetical protein
MKKFMKQVGAVAAALAIVLAIAGTASAGDVVYADVTGHAPSTSANNDADFWETGDITSCTKLDKGQGDLGVEVSTYTLSQGYELVIVKAGSTNQDDPTTLTLFANAAAGETVWADYNAGNPALGPGEGDKNISHIIFCDPTQTTTTTTTTDETTTTTTTDETTTTTTTDVTTTTTTETTDTFTSDTGGVTDAPPSEPNTATVGTNGTSAPADGAWLLVIALGVLLASIVVLTPAKAGARR